MADITIRADGIWPLETFVDAYRYQRHDGTHPRFSDHDVVVNYVDKTGNFVERASSKAIHWPDVYAYGLPDLFAGQFYCDGCGDATDWQEREENDGYCKFCDDGYW